MVDSVFTRSPLQAALGRMSARRSVRPTAAPTSPLGSPQPAMPGVADASLPPPSADPIEAASIQYQVPHNALRAIAEMAGEEGPMYAEAAAARIGPAMARGMKFSEALTSMFPEGQAPAGFAETLVRRANEIAREMQPPAPVEPVGMGERLTAGAQDTAGSLLKGGGMIASDLGATGVGGALTAAGEAVGSSDETQARIAADRARRGEGLNMLGRVGVNLPGDAAAAAPTIGVSIGGAIAGGALGSALGPLGTVGGAIAGGFMTSFPMLLDESASVAAEEGQNVEDPGVRQNIYAAAAMKSAMEQIAPFRIASRLGLAAPIQRAAGGIFRRVAKEGTETALVEGATEVAQMATDQLMLNPELRKRISEDELAELAPYILETYGEEALTNFAVGAALGGVAGGVAGIKKPGEPEAPAAPPAEEAPDQLLLPPPPIITPQYPIDAPPAAPETGIPVSAAAEPVAPPPPAGPLEAALQAGPAPILADDTVPGDPMRLDVQGESGPQAFEGVLLGETPDGVKLRLDEGGTEVLVSRAEIESGSAAVSVIDPDGTLRAALAAPAAPPPPTELGTGDLSAPAVAAAQWKPQRETGDPRPVEDMDEAKARDYLDMLNAQRKRRGNLPPAIEAKRQKLLARFAAPEVAPPADQVAELPSPVAETAPEVAIEPEQVAEAAPVEPTSTPPVDTPPAPTDIDVAPVAAATAGQDESAPPTPEGPIAEEGATSSAPPPVITQLREKAGLVTGLTDERAAEIATALNIKLTPDPKAGGHIFGWKQEARLREALAAEPAAEPVVERETPSVIDNAGSVSQTSDKPAADPIPEPETRKPFPTDEADPVFVKAKRAVAKGEPVPLLYGAVTVEAEKSGSKTRYAPVWMAEGGYRERLAGSDKKADAIKDALRWARVIEAPRVVEMLDIFAKPIEQRAKLEWSPEVSDAEAEAHIREGGVLTYGKESVATVASPSARSGISWATRVEGSGYVTNKTSIDLNRSGAITANANYRDVQETIDQWKGKRPAFAVPQKPRATPQVPAIEGMAPIGTTPKKPEPQSDKAKAIDVYSKALIIGDEATVAKMEPLLVKMLGEPATFSIRDKALAQREPAEADTLAAKVAAAAAEVDPKPTEAQRAAGNFKMGHFVNRGLDVTIETMEGGERAGFAGPMPPVPAGHVRLYRGQGPAKKLPTWIEEGLAANGAKDAQGRWFTDSLAIAMWYVKDAGPDGFMSYVDVPHDVKRASSVADNDVARKFSRDPANEYLIPREYADAAKKTPAEPWIVTLPAHYGYIKGTKGADGDHVDVYVGAFPERDQAYIFDQFDPDARDAKGNLAFDEHKIVLGASGMEDAVRIYDAGFSDKSGPRRRNSAMPFPMSIDELKAWMDTGDMKKPVEGWKAEPVAKPKKFETPEEIAAKTGIPAPVRYPSGFFETYGAKLGSVEADRAGVKRGWFKVIIARQSPYNAVDGVGATLREAQEDAARNAERSVARESSAKSAPGSLLDQAQAKAPAGVTIDLAEEPEPGLFYVKLTNAEGKKGSSTKKTIAEAITSALRFIPGKVADPKIFASIEAMDDDAPAPAAPAAPAYGASNTIFTADRAAAAREILRKRLAGNQLNAGIDPEILQAGIELMGFHLESGARRFLDAAKAVADDLGTTPQALRKYLRAWYNSSRDYLEDSGLSIEGMDDDAAVRAALAEIGTEAKPAEGAKDGLQSAVPTSDAAPSAADDARTPEDRGDGGAPRGEGEGSQRDVRQPDGDGAQAPERPSAEPRAADSGADRAGDADRVPAGPVGENFAIEPGALGEDRGWKTKARDNVKAIRLLRQIQQEKRFATREEQATLARYVGWGGIKGAFPDGDGKFSKGYEDIGAEIRELLSPEEYAQANRTIQYAHYTSETIVRAMWDAAKRLGFNGGTVFEPGMGVGNFAGMMPADIAAATQYHGIEYDGTTAGIASLLYPKWGVQHADMTRTPLQRDSYDLVIGNPPFADTPIESDPEYRQGFLIHDYFFAKSIDALRPGGILMFVTSAGTMNKLDAKARDYMQSRAKFIGGVRLPGDAFEKNAGTKVTTDILVFQRREGTDRAQSDAWSGVVPRTLPNKTGGTTAGNVSRYFSENPENVLGEEGFFDPLIANRYAVRKREGDDVGAMLRERLATLPPGILTERETPQDRAEMDFSSTEKKDGTFYLKDGVLMQHSRGAGRAVQRRGKGVEGGRTAAEIEVITALIPVRDSLRAVYAADLAGKDATRARNRLNAEYDAFVAKFGPINKADISFRRPTSIQAEAARDQLREEMRDAGKRFDEGSFDPSDMIRDKASTQTIARARKEARETAIAAGRNWDEGTFDPEEMPDVVIDRRPNIDPFMDDQESYRLRAVEHYNDMTREAKKTDVFFKNVISRETEPKIDSLEDAVLYVLNRTGRFDLDEVAKAAGKEPGVALDELGERVFERHDAPGTYELNDVYLTGNVRAKLAAARAVAETAPRFQRNVRALEAAQPADKAPSQIHASIGMPWIPADTIADFARDIGLSNVKVSHQAAMGIWSVTGTGSDAAATSEWGTSRVNAISLLSAALNRTQVKVFDPAETPEGKPTSRLNVEATEAANEKLSAIKVKFREWVWGDEARTTRLARLYNDGYNNLAHRTYDGSYLTTPGISTAWSWRPHQKRVIARIIQTGNTYMAHSVGAGKTSAMIGAGMEMKRLGLVNKPLYAVPNHMLGQFTKEFYEQYPTARIAVADERRFHTDRRKQFIADVAMADLDAVIITHSGFEMIPVSDQFQADLIAEQVEEYREILSEIGKDQESRITRGKIEAQIERLEQRLEGRKGRKDAVFTFEEMGVDFLFVDEAHMYRKLDFATRMGSIKGIDGQGSGRAWDLYVKTRFLDRKKPGRNLVLASGTPITNTMAELYTLQRYMQRGELRARNIEQFDAWAAAFGDVATTLEQNAAGGYDPVTRFSQFVNMGELSGIVRQNVDVVTSRQLAQYVTRPALKGCKRKMNLAERSPELSRYQQRLADRMKAIKERKGPPKPGDDIMLSVINDGRHAAIDMRFVDPAIESKTPSKLELLVENVHRIWEETKDQPFFVPKKDGSGYGDVPAMRGPAAQMVFATLGLSGTRGFSTIDHARRQLIAKGVPRDEIAYIADYKSHVARQRLFNDVNEGKVRILMGSVAKMGTGVNAQKRLIAIHNLDPLWYPADDDQRNGRGIRQGNMNPEIEINDYSTKGTYDSSMWGMMERKARFIDDFWEGTGDLGAVEDLGEASQYEQAKAISTADPRMIVLVEKRQELQKAERKKDAHTSEAWAARSRAEGAEWWIGHLNKRIPQAQQAIEQTVPTRGDAFKIRLGDTEFEKRTEAGEALDEMIQARRALVETGQLTADPRPIGQLGGFPVVLGFETTSKGEIRGDNLFLRAPHDDSITSNSLTGYGWITAVENRIAGFPDALEAYKRDLAQYTEEARLFREAAAKPFTGGAEIKRLREELAALEAEISAVDDGKPKPEELSTWDDDGGMRYSRGAAPATPFRNVRELQTALSAHPLGGLIDSAIGAGRVRLHKTAASLPGGPHPAGVQGMTSENGTIHLVADALDASTAPGVLLHETFHAGAEALVGSAAWKGMLERIERMAKTGPWWERAKARAGGSAEEMAAYAIEEREGAPARLGEIVERMIGAVQAFILRRWGRQIGRVTPAQLRALAVAALRSQAAPGPQPGGGARYSAAGKTDTPAFKRWFGKSKVVNSDGSPMVVYHGTYADFSTFDRTEDIGFHFGDRGAAGSRIGQDWGPSADGASVMPVYLRMVKPLRLRDLGTWEPGDVADALVEAGIITQEQADDTDIVDRDQVTEWMDAKGYDGIIYKNETEMEGREALVEAMDRAWARYDAAERGTPEWRKADADLNAARKADRDFRASRGTDSYIVFRTEQIKSAIGNSGDYDGGNADIRYSIAIPSAASVADYVKGESKLLYHALTMAMSGNTNLLALTPGRPLFSELGKDMPAAQEYLRLKEEMDALRQEWHARMDETAQAWRTLGVKGPEASALMDLMHEATLAGTDPSERFVALGNEKDAARQVAWADLRKRFRALPAEHQAMFKRVRDDYKRLGDEFDATLEANVAAAMDFSAKAADRRYEEALESANDEGLTGEARDRVVTEAKRIRDRAKIKAEMNKKSRMVDLRKLFETQKVPAPYFPLARFGQFFATTRDRDGKVLSFSRFESSRARDRWAAEQRKDSAVEVTVGVIGENSMRGMVDPQFVAAVEGILMDADAPNGVMDQVWQRYLETMPDLSLRKNRIHRKGTPGFSADAFRAFGHHQFHGAHQLARLKYARGLEEALDLAEKQAAAAPDPTRAGLVHEEMKKRHAFTINPTGAWWSQALTSAAFVYYLALTPAAAIVNLSQTSIMGTAILGAYGGTGAAAKQLVRALGDFTRNKGWIQNAEGLPKDEIDAMEEAYRRGTIDRSQAHDLAGVGETGVEYSAVRTKVMAGISWFFHNTERMNREITFLAAYRMAKEKGLNHGDAVDKAADLTWKTHFDYAGSSRPRLLQNDYTKVAFVFRAFQINMLWRLFRDTHQSVAGASPEARAEARKQLAGVTGMFFLHAGIRGVWGFTLAMGLMSLFTEGDGDDLEDELKRNLVETLGPTAAGVLLNGATGQTFGVDLVNRMGMPELWFRSPDRQLEGASEYQFWVSQMLGAAVGIFENVWRGVSMISDGNVQRGIETIMPKAIRDQMRAFRYLTEGATTMKGDPILEDMPWTDALKQSIGFTPAGLAEQYQSNSLLKRREARIADERQAIVSKIATAIRSGEPVTRTMIAEVGAFNKANPTWPIERKTIDQSVGSRERASQRVISGTSLNPRLDEVLRSGIAPLVNG